MLGGVVPGGVARGGYPARVPPAARYHRLGRTGRHRWWLPLAGTFAVLVAAVAAVLGTYLGALIVFALIGVPLTDEGLPENPLLEEAVLLVGIASWIPLALLGAVLVQRRPARTVHSVAGRLRPGWLGRCLLAATGVTVAMFAVISILSSDDSLVDLVRPEVSWGFMAAAAAVYLTLVPLQAAGEEYLCRGWLLQAFGAYTRGPWLGIAVSSVLFAAAHGWGSGWGTVGLLVNASLWGWLTVRTGGLEASIALHTVNNVIAFLATAAAGEAGSDETAANAPGAVALVLVAASAVYTILVCWLARRANLTTVTAEAGPPLEAGRGNPSYGSASVTV